MILVTGASGYVGSHIVKKLVAAGKPVRAMVHNPDRAKTEGRLQGLDIDWVQGDVTRPETLEKALEGVTAVIHTVAIAIEKGGRKYEVINYEGTVNMVDAAKKMGVRRFLNMSQMGAKADLPYRFLASKGKAQDYVAASGLDWTAVRPSVIWGPEDEFANTFARLVPLSPVIYPIIGDDNAKFQSIWVDDVAEIFLKILDDDSTIGQEYEVGGPEIMTLQEIERRTLKAINKKRIMIPFPMPILKVVVTLMETLLPAPPVTRSLLELLAVPNTTANNEVYRFVESPRPFNAENAAPYMRKFTVKETLGQFFGK